MLTASTSVRSSGMAWLTGVNFPSTPAACTKTSNRPNRATILGATDFELFRLAQVQRQQRRGAAGGTDGVVGILQPALRPCGDHHVRAQSRERHGGCRAEPRLAPVTNATRSESGDAINDFR